MNKLNLFLLLSSSLLLAACNQTSAPITGTDQQKAEKLSQIVASGGKARCTVTNLSDKSSTEIIVSGKKMKIVDSDFGEGKKGSMINDGTYNYIWSKGDKTGFKTKIESTDTPSVTPAEGTYSESVDTQSTAAGFEDETKYKMDCTAGSISDSEFTPPSDVTFTDFAELMQGIPTIPTKK